MSIKAFKEFFQSCPVRSCPVPASSQIFTEERKPRKTSLKDKIASWDRAREGSTIDSSNGTSSSSASAASATVGSELEKSFGLVFGRKRPFDETCTVLEISGENGFGRKRPFLQSCSRLEKGRTSGDRVEERKSESGPPSSSRRAKFESRKAASLYPSDQLPSEAGKIVEEEKEAKILPLEGEDEMGRDSEAGLFAQPEPEGPFEPLVLWPPSGESSSHGVENDRIVQVPPSINSRLLEHQRGGVQFLYQLYRQNEGGILGDDMGLGKTIQSIAFLSAILRKKWDMEGNVDSTSIHVGSRKQRCEKVVLIICPTSVLQNWENEFLAWGEFVVGIYHGQQREFVLAKVASKEMEVVLTSHDTFRIHGDELCKLKWDCVIVDEAHRLKNDRSQLYIMCSKLPTKRRYGLTGTVMQNKYMELFNVFDWASPGSLGTRDHFREYYAGPIKEGQRISAPQRFVIMAEDRQKHLNVLLKSHFLRRTKQETIGHLMKGKEDNVAFCPMSSIQKRVYKRVLQSPDYQALIHNSSPCTCGSPLTRGACCYRTVPNGVIWPYLHKDSLEDGCDFCPSCLVLPCLTKLKQVSNHLELIKPNPKDDLEKQNKDCKFALTAFGEDLHVVGGIQQEESFLGLSDAQHCGKMCVLERLLSSWIFQGDKVLLFSDSVKMLDILDKFLIRKGYCFCRLDGSIPMTARQGLVEDFNHSPSKQVFLISTRAGGLGLNLTSANRVVIFDPNWNPAHDLQAQDRSFRFGQNRHVTVFRLLGAGTLEELIYTRQIYKQQLFNIALSGAPEKRYFEGVQGSKQHKGELFGMGNLFRDISEDIFAEDIIENHDERLVRMKQQEALVDTPNVSEQQLKCIALEDDDEEVDHQGDLTCVETEDLGCTQPVARDQDEELAEDERRNQIMVQKALTTAGVVYSHRNEDVVNLGVAPNGLQRKVKFASNVQNKSKKQQKKVPVKVSARKLENKENDACQPQHKNMTVESEDSIATTVRPTARVVGEDKRAIFAKLAKFKGMDPSEFSKWFLLATQNDRTQLRAEYNKVNHII